MSNRFNLWTIHPDPDRFRSFELQDRSLDWLKYLSLYKSGVQLAPHWPEVVLKLVEGDESETAKPVPDFARGFVSKALSERGRASLETCLAGQVEYLPLSTPAGRYYELNVQRIDCLDLQHSTVKRFESSGRIKQVLRYAFHWAKLEGVAIFWLPELNLSKTFVSEAFKQAVEDNKLTGFIFEPLPMIERSPKRRRPKRSTKSQ